MLGWSVRINEKQDTWVFFEPLSVYGQKFVQLPLFVQTFHAWFNNWSRLTSVVVSVVRIWPPSNYNKDTSSFLYLCCSCLSDGEGLKLLSKHSKPYHTPLTCLILYGGLNETVIYINKLLFLSVYIFFQRNSDHMQKKLQAWWFLQLHNTMDAIFFQNKKPIFIKMHE